MRGPDPVDAHPPEPAPTASWTWSATSGNGPMNSPTSTLAPPSSAAASYYQPQGSIWYFPQAYRNTEHSKLLLMAPGYDRSGGIGFRCVKDAP